MPCNANDRASDLARASASDWVSGLFAASASDWTPAGAPPGTRVLFAPVVPRAEALRRCAAVLSAAEVERSGRFLTAAGRSHFTQRRAFRRYCGALALGSSRPLGRVDFGETGKGCPYLAEAPALSFSFSACALGFLGAWSPTHAIGVDIEDRTRRLEPVALARRYFRDAEAQAVAGAAAAASMTLFLTLWTLKEAALKSIGEGLPYGLDAFGFELAPVPRMVHAPADRGGPASFGVHMLGGADTPAAIVWRRAGLAR